MARKIFVNYRRDDSGAHALAVAQFLEREFGAANVFIDVDRIRAGEEFPVVLKQKLDACRALVAVIGPQWLKVVNESGNRRIDDPEDWVRLEIVEALKRGLVVMPVLVDGAELPKTKDLPEDLRLLVQKQATRVTPTGFRHEMRGLAGDIRRAMPMSRAAVAALALGGLLLGGGAALGAYYYANLPKPQLGPSGSDALTGKPFLGGVLRATYGDWQVRCAKSPDTSRDQCAVIQSVKAEDRPNVIVTALLLRSTDKKLMLRTIAPSGVLVTAGLGLKIDGRDVGRTSFVRCISDGCVSEVVLDDKLTTELRSGKTATFVIFEAQDKGLGLPMSLKGLAPALDELP